MEPPLDGRPPAEGSEEFVPLRLVLEPGGAAVEVTRPVLLIGRHSEADLRLPLPDVSRRHCRLELVEGCWQVVDLHSLNGIFVNGEQVLQAPLAAGDRLKIGGFTFLVEMPAAEEEQGHVHSIIKTLARNAEEPPRRKAS
jgi:pSer/pThr/pTyr-binding forkhead associated (FHA) protein